MRDRLLHPWRPSEGEKQLLTAIFGVAIFGGMFSFVIVSQMGEEKSMLRHLSLADLWFVTAGALGAMGGIYLGRRWLGHPGPRGALLATLGVPMISFLCAVIGGTLALPFYGTMFGPMIFALTLLGNPFLAVVWFTVLTATHFLMAGWRRERESLFAPAPRIAPDQAAA